MVRAELSYSNKKTLLCTFMIVFISSGALAEARFRHDFQVSMGNETLINMPRYEFELYPDDTVPIYIIGAAGTMLWVVNSCSVGVGLASSPFLFESCFSFLAAPTLELNGQNLDPGYLYNATFNIKGGVRLFAFDVRSLANAVMFWDRSYKALPANLDFKVGYTHTLWENSRNIKIRNITIEVGISIFSWELPAPQRF